MTGKAMANWVFVTANTQPNEMSWISVNLRIWLMCTRLIEGGWWEFKGRWWREGLCLRGWGWGWVGGGFGVGVGGWSGVGVCVGGHLDVVRGRPFRSVGDKE